MNVIAKITVAPSLPARIERLKELAYNLYWSWTPLAWGLFESLDLGIWERYNHNPVRSLLEVDHTRLEEMAADKDFLKRYDAVIKAFDAYMKAKKTWFSNKKVKVPGKVAYFSAEFAYAESLPIYSGGLGVLAGDHCKSASDLGLPFVAVGLVYHQGYFIQTLNKDGWQEESYETLDFQTLPLEPALDPQGKEVVVQITLLERVVKIKVWKLNVGRIPVYLMDTNLPENTEADRELTARLYGGNQEMRIQQEMVLGIGGIRALRVIQEDIGVYHMNEGHAAFLGLERIRELMAADLSLTFWEASEAVAGNAIFTTHTPVPAGNDAFPLELVGKYLGKWFETFKISYDDFMGIANHTQAWGPTYSMTVLALRLSRAANGVSALHGEVSRKMWNFLYPGAFYQEVPIGHVTNGAHTLTFLAQELRDLYSTVLPKDWTEKLEDRSMWDALDKIPDADLVQTTHNLKKEMIDFVRGKLKVQYTRHEASAARIASADQVLDPHALTIGFARRFATYKRATLLFSDLARLKRILSDAERPVQFVFAGKAHPADNPGKQFIQAIYRFAQDPDLAGKIVIIENYDMKVARHLVQGVDIWMNNPRRPLEASGTSGMKASFNGALNFSILDGWWCESFDGTNGFAIGDEREFTSLAAQDDFDAYSMYETLEKVIIPAYYERDENGLRARWQGMVRNAIKTVAPKFSMQRQVIDYTEQYYLPLWAQGVTRSSDHYAEAKSLAQWKNDTKWNWHGVTIEAFSEAPVGSKVGDPVKVQARVFTNSIAAQDLLVEAVIERQGSEDFQTTPLTLVSENDGWAEYAADVILSSNGQFNIGARVIPFRAELSNKLELALITWA